MPPASKAHSLSNAPAQSSATTSALKRGKIPGRKKTELLHRAGYQCSICHRLLRKFDSGNITDVVEIAHIYPHGFKGPRWDQGPRPADVDDISNLMALCPNCHEFADKAGISDRLFTLDQLRTIKREHEGWITFRRLRDPVESEHAALSPAAVSAIRRGESVSVWGHAYRLPADDGLPADDRPDRVDATFQQEWSPDHDAARTQSYAYAETGAARHAWLRRIDALDGSQAGDCWRGELTDEALHLHARLPALPGLPRVLGMSPTAREPCTLVTALPSTVSLKARYGTSRGTVMGTEAVRALLAGLPTLCAALGALHDADLAHGALDPRTLLVDRRGDVSLRDLGLATAGHPGRPLRTTKDADVRRLAAIVYELVTGVLPLAEPDGPPVPASVYNPAVPEYADTALTQALTGSIGDARTLARRLRAAARPTPR